MYIYTHIYTYIHTHTIYMTFKWLSTWSKNSPPVQSTYNFQSMVALSSISGPPGKLWTCRTIIPNWQVRKPRAGKFPRSQSEPRVVSGQKSVFVYFFGSLPTEISSLTPHLLPFSLPAALQNWLPESLQSDLSEEWPWLLWSSCIPTGTEKAER